MLCFLVTFPPHSVWSELVANMSRDPDDVNKLTESTYKVNIRGNVRKKERFSSLGILGEVFFPS